MTPEEAQVIDDAFDDLEKRKRRPMGENAQKKLDWLKWRWTEGKALGRTNLFLLQYFHYTYVRRL